jgi:hypothetical protein
VTARQAELFDGATYAPPRDERRLFKQLQDVRAYMRDGLWHTLPDIAAGTGHPEASISARLRDLRKPRWGAHVVERQYLSRGLWRYRLDIPLRRAG